MKASILTRTVAALVIALLGFAGSAGALMVPVPVEQLLEQSPRVLRGKVTDTRSEWTADRSTIVTRVTLAVTETWAGKANPGEPVVVTVEGGVVGKTGVYVEHQPAFVKGEDVVLMLHPGERGEARVTGAIQGKYTVAGSLVVGFDHRPKPFQAFRSDIQQKIRERKP